LYGNPVLVVLDEPNSNLDDIGEKALALAIQSMRQRGATVLLITHRASILAHVDNLVVLMNGQMEMAGPRDDILKRLKGQQ
jgi:ATP-binding cassette subfamily C protein EexD